MLSLRYIIVIIITWILISLAFPTAAYAMSPEDMQDVYATFNKHPVESYKTPYDYWVTHSHENDVYALHQKSIYLGEINQKAYLESKEYPFGPDSIYSQNDISKTVVCKSKFVWFTWKRYTKEFSSLNQFRSSLDNSFSIRNELKKDIMKKFYK